MNKKNISINNYKFKIQNNSQTSIRFIKYEAKSNDLTFQY